jgi:hypothetical protein
VSSLAQIANDIPWCFIINCFVVLVLHLLQLTQAVPTSLTRVRRQFSPFSRFRNGAGFIFPDSTEDDRYIDNNIPAAFRPENPRPVFMPTAAPKISQMTTPRSQPTNPTTSASYRRCLNNCLTTNEYNPVCGTNEQSYDNQNKLNCAISCGAGEWFGVILFC